MGTTDERMSTVHQIEFEPISTGSDDFVEAIRRHYPGSCGAPYGKKQGYRIFERGTIIGWIGLGEPVYRTTPRRNLGIDDGRAPSDSVSIFMYRLESERVASASSILRLWHPIAQVKWAVRYGIWIRHWETFVGRGDPSNPGCALKRSGYRRCGNTLGVSFRRSEHDIRIKHNTSRKIYLYRGPLKRLPEQDWDPRTR